MPADQLVRSPLTRSFLPAEWEALSGDLGGNEVGDAQRLVGQGDLPLAEFDAGVSGDGVGCWMRGLLAAHRVDRLRELGDGHDQR